MWSCIAPRSYPPCRVRHASVARRLLVGSPGTTGERSIVAELVADFVLARLREWGVHRIYGYPGDGINALVGAFDRAGGDPEFVQVRHEEMAAFMACAHAKWT